MALFGGSKKSSTVQNRSTTKNNTTSIQGGSAPVINLSPGDLGGSFSPVVDLTYTDLNAVAGGLDLAKSAITSSFNDLALARESLGVRMDTALDTLSRSVGENLDIALDFAEGAAQPDKELFNNTIMYFVLGLGALAVAFSFGGKK